MKTLHLRYFDEKRNIHEIRKFENVTFEGVAHSVASVISSQPRYNGIYVYLVDDENEISEVYLNGYRIMKFDHDKIVWERTKEEIKKISDNRRVW